MDEDSTPSGHGPSAALRAQADIVKLPRLVAKHDNYAQWVRVDVSPTTKAIIWVSGEMGPKQIGKLIRLLEVQKAVLEDDEPRGLSAAEGPPSPEGVNSPEKP